MSVSVNWDLDSIFTGGSHSAALADFLAQLTADLELAEAAGLPPALSTETESDWVAAIQTLFDLGARLNQAGSFVGCLMAQDVKDDKALQLMAQTDQLSARLGTLWTKFTAAFAEQDEEAWQHLVAETELHQVAFYLNESRDLARRKMAPALETLANELAADGYHAWDRLYGITSGDKEVQFEGQPLSLGQLQSKYMDDPDREVRQRAFALFETAWSDLAKTCALALNYQAGFRLTLYKHRGWQSVLQEPLHNNRLSAETLEAMWGVIDARSAKLLDYFRAKAKLFGVAQLHWVDVAAPVGEVTKTFSYAEAADFVVSNVDRFDPAIAAYCRLAIDRHWIEAENRAGKRAGAYCTSLPLIGESRIFMTYTGSFNGMLTLAHELGHGYHSWAMRDLPYGARRYAMSVAETASNFNELIVTNAGLEAAADERERLSILGSKLNDAASHFMNIRARFDFEREFFKQRAKKHLSVDELSELMTAAQQTAFKEGLSGYHPLFWASKLHFYITRAPFYNFPYTFGYLFSNGLYARALDEGASFSDRYIALLRDTGSMSTEDLARTHLGVDLTKPDFWETAVARVLADVDEFVKLVD